ncbi:MAG: hypothetical protein RLZZ303_2721 [Candidatus Hydrogenedentota bacterium]|jgi:ferredoxin
MKMNLNVDDIRAFAQELGADLVGFADWMELEETAPDYDKPSLHTSHLTTLIVLARRTSIGIAGCKNSAVQQYALGRSLAVLEEVASKLAYHVESKGHSATVVSTLVPDSRTQPAGFASPAGQGSALIRQAAVNAGLGTLGLNGMLITPQFGPRVKLMGVLTNLRVKTDQPLNAQLCIGAEKCGRCIRACPVDAIPAISEAKTLADSIAAFRADACAKRCQPTGPEALVSYMRKLASLAPEERKEHVMGSDEIQRLFHALVVLRHSAFTGCMECETACPVGDDFPRLERWMLNQ